MRKYAWTLILLSTLSPIGGCKPISSNVHDSEIKRNVEKILADALVNQVFIEGGTFVMGDFGVIGEDGVWRPYFPPANEINKAHKVTLSNYSIAKYKTTWEEYDSYRLASGKSVIVALDDRGRHRPPYDQNPSSYEYIKRPAEVTWQEAKNYCFWLAEQTGLLFDLPTSAQWEFAGRNLGRRDWVYPTHDGKPVDNSSAYAKAIRDQGRTGPVGTRLPANPLGLYDMAENAREWVNDWFSENYYSKSPETNDPQGPPDGTEKVLRALGTGSLNFSFSRFGAPERLPDGLKTPGGFRCAVQSPEPATRTLLN
ncbi:hypothetical protein LCGC14_0763020 [marine sediment metagenome]|nr:SUMF1/EgtB/PvdO family nonheme iron enzyme [Marinobacter antarcticus]